MILLCQMKIGYILERREKKTSKLELDDYMKNKNMKWILFRVYGMDRRLLSENETQFKTKNMIGIII
jgi:hypothetical protein